MNKMCFGVEDSTLMVELKNRTRLGYAF